MRLPIAPPSSSPFLVLLCLLLSPWLGGCGDSEPAGRSFERVATTPERTWEAGDSEVVSRFEIPEQLEPWTYDSKEMEVQDAPAEHGGGRVVMLHSDVAKTLNIPLADDQAEFNQVRFKVVMQKHSSISVDLLSKGRVLLRTPYALVIGSRKPQLITIDLPAARTVEFQPDTLVLRFAGGARRVHCWDIEVLRRPWESWAADFSEGRGRPVADHVAREAGALATDNPRSVEFVVPPRGRMSFHYAQAPRLTVPKVDTQLTVTVTGESEQIDGRWTLEKRKIGMARWEPASLDLSPLAGQRVRAQFTLSSGSRKVDYALVTTPIIFEPVAAPRTVLFITSDTHRADHVAISKGAVEVRTPTLDALAERGVIFDDCYSSTNITVPSHVALLTAVPPRDTLVLDNMSGIAEEARTLAESFRADGWATLASVSGSQLQDAWSGLGQGFDAMACPSSMTWDGRETVERLLGMMAEVEDRDLFVWLHLFDAHRPYKERTGLVELYYPEGRDPYDPALPDPEFPRAALKEEMPGLRDPDFMDANYKAGVTYTDQILQHLFDVPRVRDGWIAFTADHGECLGEYQIWWDHAGLYPGNLRVPMFLVGPDVPAGTRVAGPVQHLDIGRTLIELAGVDDPDFPGESMLRHLEREPEVETPRFALASQAKSASVEMGGWFCILQLGRWRAPGMETPKPEHSVELYDLRFGKDPLRNVAEEEVERARRMRTLILNWLAEQQPTGWVEQDQANDAARIDQVQALGYTAEATDGSSIWLDPDCDCEYCELFGAD